MLDFTARKHRIITAPRGLKPTTRARQSAQKAAQRLSRLGWSKASAELINEAMSQFLRLLFAFDADAGIWPHVDEGSGVILLPTPMSSKSYAKWGLRRTEAAALRLHLVRLEDQARKGQAPAPALVYDADVRRWLLNRDYTRLQEALTWWGQHEMSARDFAAYSRELRKKIA